MGWAQGASSPGHPGTACAQPQQDPTHKLPHGHHRKGPFSGVVDRVVMVGVGFGSLGLLLDSPGRYDPWDPIVNQTPLPDLTDNRL